MQFSDSRFFVSAFFSEDTQKSSRTSFRFSSSSSDWFLLEQLCSLFRPRTSSAKQRTLIRGLLPPHGISVRLVNFQMSPPAGTPPPPGTTPSGNPPLRGISSQLVNPNPSPYTETPPPPGTSPSGNPPLQGISSQLVNTNSSLSARAPQPSGDSRREARRDILLLTAQRRQKADREIETDDHEMESDDQEDEEETTSKTLPSSVYRSQPLTGGPAMSAALDEIASDSRGRRTRDHDPAQRLRDLLEAKKQAEAGNKTEAKKAAATGQVPGPRSYGRDQAVSDSSRSGSSQSTSTNQPAPIPAFEDMRQGFPAKDRPQSSPKSTADLEMLRLKDRQTLHRLDRSW